MKENFELTSIINIHGRRRKLCLNVVASFLIPDLFTKEIGLNLGKEMTVFRISRAGRFYFF